MKNVTSRRQSRLRNRSTLPFGTTRLTVVVARRPDSQLVYVAYTWPCFNCRTLVEVDEHVHEELRAKVLGGIKCNGCLNPAPAMRNREIPTAA